MFRHHATPPAARARLLRRVARLARARQLLVVVAGRGARADGVHGHMHGHGVRTWPAHDRREALAGVRAHADALFVSPIFATRSHPGAPAIGAQGAIRIGRGVNIPLIALGGMTSGRWRKLRRLGFHGWAAIDAWL
ncbi:MAG: thiamine phosphate synthase [Sphingomonas sp.]